jgi:hypothetical protein
MLAACVLVFAFALHAKVAVYQQSAQPQTSTSAKLWLNGEKSATDPIFPSIAVLWFAVFAVWLIRQRPAMQPVGFERVPAMLHAQQVFLNRLLHSPPIG